jgi:hypothetical protein
MRRLTRELQVSTVDASGATGVPVEPSVCGGQNRVPSSSDARGPGGCETRRVQGPCVLSLSHFLPTFYPTQSTYAGLR